MKINYRKRRLTLDEQMRIVTDYNAGMPVKEILEKYNIARATVYNTLKKQIN